ncbi:hypothetical protein PROFUN_13202, partial [Planoprotostelium fungivorum]
MSFRPTEARLPGRAYSVGAVSVKSGDINQTVFFSALTYYYQRRSMDPKAFLYDYASEIANDKKKQPNCAKGVYASAACTFCKKRHYKCDGRLDGCINCISRNEVCVYPNKVKKRGPRTTKKVKTEVEGTSSSVNSPASSPLDNHNNNIVFNQSSNNINIISNNNITVNNLWQNPSAFYAQENAEVKCQPISLPIPSPSELLSSEDIKMYCEMTHSNEYPPVYIPKRHPDYAFNYTKVDSSNSFGSLPPPDST